MEQTCHDIQYNFRIYTSLAISYISSSIFRYEVLQQLIIKLSWNKAFCIYKKHILFFVEVFEDGMNFLKHGFLHKDGILTNLIQTAWYRNW